MNPIILVAALSDNGVIGICGTLPWRLPLDLKWFKMHTFQGAVIMGRKTWDSLPRKPLVGRLNIVLSRRPGRHTPTESVVFCSSLREALNVASERASRTYVIGGEDVFVQTVARASTFILTRVHRQVHGKSAKFLPLPRRLCKVWASDRLSYRGTDYTFQIWTRQKCKGRRALTSRTGADDATDDGDGVIST